MKAVVRGPWFVRVVSRVMEEAVVGVVVVRRRRERRVVDVVVYGDSFMVCSVHVKCVDRVDDIG